MTMILASSEFDQFDHKHICHQLSTPAPPDCKTCLCGLHDNPVMKSLQSHQDITTSVNSLKHFHHQYQYDKAFYTGDILCERTHSIHSKKNWSSKPSKSHCVIRSPVTFTSENLLTNHIHQTYSRDIFTAGTQFIYFHHYVRFQRLIHSSGVYDMILNPYKEAQKGIFYVELC